MKKSLQLFGLMAFMFVFASGVKAQTLHGEMFKKFGELADWMNTPLINSHIEKTAELDVKFHGLLDETAISNAKIIPLGKVVKGKNVILLYLYADYSAEGKLLTFNLHSVTLNKKTGKKVGFEKYLLQGGNVSNSMYNGSYKLKEKGLIVITQNEVDNDEKKENITQKEYKFGKELEYVKTIDSVSLSID